MFVVSVYWKVLDYMALLRSLDRVMGHRLGSRVVAHAEGVLDAVYIQSEIKQVIFFLLLYLFVLDVSFMQTFRFSCFSVQCSWFVSKISVLLLFC